jgi:hypothetical protein
MRIVLLAGGEDATAQALATGLRARQHDVRLIADRPFGPLESRLARRGYEAGLTAVPGDYARLRRIDPALAHAFGLAASLAAARWSANTQRPALLTLAEPPSREWLLARRRRLAMVLKAAHANATILVRDRASAEALRWSLGLEAVVIDPTDAPAHHALYLELT